MRVQLINPPELAGYISDRDKAGGLGTMFPINRRFRYRAFTPPMDLLYCAALAERTGAETGIIDACGEQLKGTRLMLKLEAARPEVVGVRLSLPSLKEDLTFARMIKAMLPATRVFAFGNVIQTTHADWLAGCGLDGVLFGEAEALLEAFLLGRYDPHVWTPDCAQAPTGWYLQDSAELEALPFPAWHLVEMARYAPKGQPELATYYLLTSRGCPKACSMCPYFVHQGGPWRSRSVASVKAELDHLRALGAVTIQARDPNIGLVKKRLKAIAEVMASGNYHFRWVIETDLESLDPETIASLARGGLVRLMTGIESTSPEILREIHQHPDALKLTLTNIALCRTHAIALTGFMVVGSTSESFETVNATVNLARELPMNYSVSLMTPYPGTVYRREAAQAGHLLANRPLRDLGGTACVVRTRHLDARQLKLCYRWAQGELELKRRERAMASSRGLAKVWSTLQWAKHQIWHAPCAAMFAWERSAERRKAALSAQNLAGIGS